ncbi:MAG: hypothetical protein IT303_04155 [Dehalococcoidia bacterium]|nr:hypothetical protein [Dehalococcoidia bacterium]
MTSQDLPSDGATLERAWLMATEAMYAVALQRRRMSTTEPEDSEFVMRWWWDCQCLVSALWHLRMSAELAASVTPSLSRSVTDFDSAIPDLRTLRNVQEHLDEYAVENGRNPRIHRSMLHSGSFDGTTWWFGRPGSAETDTQAPGIGLNLDRALAAAEGLYGQVLVAFRGATKHVGGDLEDR